MQSKYIHNLIKKAEQRKWEQEIVYERKLVKERNKEDHLYADKDKFVTSAYKKKLAEQAKWMEEERIRQLREEKDDVSVAFPSTSCTATCQFTSLLTTDLVLVLYFFTYD